MAEEKKMSLRLKWALGVMTSILLLISAILFHYARKIEPMVSARIKETIITATDSLYSIEFSSVKINPITGNVKLRDIHFKANAEILNRLKERGLNPAHIYDISVKSIYLKRAHPIDAYFNRRLDVKALVIEQPEVRMYYQTPGLKLSEPDDKRSTWQRLSKYVRSIHIMEILLNDVNFKYIDRSTSKPDIDGVKNLSVKIEDLLIDSLSENDKSRFYYAKDISAEIRDHEYLSSDGGYKVFFEQLKVASRNKTASITGIKLLPLFPEMPVINKEEGRRIRYQLDLNEIKFSNVDFKRLINRRQLRASALSFNGLSMNVFLNKSLPKPDYDRGINFPHVALKRFKLNAAIDTVKLSDASIGYSEYNPITAKRGRLFLNSINGSITNFTNDSSSLLKKNWANSSFTSLLYGKGKLDLAINFNLSAQDAEYNYSGRLSAFNPRYFNQLLRPLALMQISGGQIDKANFSVKSNYRRSTGEVNLYYSDLKVGILKMNANKKLRKSTLLSMVANNLLLKEDNPSAGEAFRKGRIEYQRPDSIAFFSAMWNSIYTGLKETIGLTEKREKELMQQFEGFKPADRELRDKKKQARRERRIQRLRKRKN